MFCGLLAKENDEVIEVLLKDKRVNPSVNDNSCIRQTSGRGNLEMVVIRVNMKSRQKNWIMSGYLV